MLTGLNIKNYTLIDDIKVRFNKGFSVITGETGAGKSILLEGLGLVLGNRADLNSLKDNSEKCIIEAEFNIATYNLQALFKENDLDYETQTIIRREILPSGKSRAFINDTPVTLQVLERLSNYLVDIHSQHETLKLIDNEFQFQVIDALANTAALLNEYKTEYKSFQKNQKKLEALKHQQNNAAKEHDYNSFLLNELKSAQLKPDTLTGLEQEYEALSNIETIKEVLATANKLLNDEQIGVINVLNNLKSNLQKITTYHPKYQNLLQRIQSTQIELDDVFVEIEAQENLLEDNPESLEKIDRTLKMWHNLMQKHAVNSVEDLIEIQLSLEKNVSFSETVNDDILKQERALEAQKNKLTKLAEQIHNTRLKAAPELENKLENLLKKLGINHAQFKIDLTLTETFHQNGTSQIQLLFSANKGIALQPLKKAASGGEMSRIMLAIKSIIANYKALPTIIFDEIDSGVSGEIANVMGSIMLQMSDHMQVLAITHLPQVAAKGHTHYKIYKEAVNQNTQTNLVQLNTADRITEIAEMLGGKQVSTSAIAHAKQLLN